MSVKHTSITSTPIWLRLTFSSLFTWIIEAAVWAAVRMFMPVTFEPSKLFETFFRRLRRNIAKCAHSDVHFHHGKSAAIDVKHFCLVVAQLVGIEKFVLQPRRFTLNIVLEKFPNFILQKSPFFGVGKYAVVGIAVPCQVGWALVPALVATRTARFSTIFAQLGNVV